mmetsp:Transcript_17697/g.26341  ORF Transcript_17697/g.26341 Transcript_17697/m.26341 type:complete len:379 (-) Transcript_17697:55-1191(-)
MSCARKTQFDPKKESDIDTRYRRASCGFLQDAGMKLQLPQLTIATAIVFFHKYFSFHSLKKGDRFVIATTCLFLASKVEETPKKLRDVIAVTHRIRGGATLNPTTKQYTDFRNKILFAERDLLQTIAFDLTVPHPYKNLLQFVKSLGGSHKLAQVSWNFVNDSLRTTLCLQYQPETIACASIYLASRFLQQPILIKGKETPWWKAFDTKFEHIEDIMTQILDLYESGSVIPGNNKTNAVTPTKRSTTTTTTSSSSSSKPSGKPRNPPATQKKSHSTQQQPSHSVDRLKTSRREPQTKAGSDASNSHTKLPPIPLGGGAADSKPRPPPLPVLGAKNSSTSTNKNKGHHSPLPRPGGRGDSSRRFQRAASLTEDSKYSPY